MDVQYLYFYGHTKNVDDGMNRHVFSQWYGCKFIDDENIEYCSAEQYMMAKKAKLFVDNVMYDKIMESTDQKEIKQLGRKIKNFDDKTWDVHKYMIVVLGNYYKFSQNKDLLDILKNTGNMILAEASPYDNVWGIGISSAQAMKGVQWKGQNLLGNALMEVRSMLV